MSTITILDVRGKTEYDGKGTAVLTSFKRIERHSPKEIKKLKKKHHIARTKCESAEDVCKLTDEMRWIQYETQCECRFSKVGNESLASILKAYHDKQEINGFEGPDIAAVILFLADSSEADPFPTKRSTSVTLSKVQIQSYEESLDTVIVDFSTTEKPRLIL